MRCVGCAHHGHGIEIEGLAYCSGCQLLLEIKGVSPGEHDQYQLRQ